MIIFFPLNLNILAGSPPYIIKVQFQAASTFLRGRKLYFLFNVAVLKLLTYANQNVIMLSMQVFLSC